MAVNIVVVKVLGKGAKANEKRLEGWQKNEMRHVTFKEREKKYTRSPRKMCQTS